MSPVQSQTYDPFRAISTNLPITGEGGGERPLARGTRTLVLLAVIFAVVGFLVAYLTNWNFNACAALGCVGVVILFYGWEKDWFSNASRPSGRSRRRKERKMRKKTEREERARKAPGRIRNEQNWPGPKDRHGI